MRRTPEMGFTLIEILVVCLRIGIVTLIADLHILITAEEGYCVSNGTYSSSLALLKQCHLFSGNATPIGSATTAGVTSCS